MVIIIILLVVLCTLLTAKYILLRKMIKDTTEQLQQMQSRPDSNRLVKASMPDSKMEKLLVEINQMYEEHQQQRILYQRRETQIRQEIENISHDLRTPLTSIIGYVELIKDKNGLTKEQEEYLDIIKKRAKILQGFIEDFYELSQIEAEDYQMTLANIQLQKIIKEVALGYFKQFEEKGIEVEVKLLDTPIYIIADITIVQRILSNLVQNALKYATKKFTITQRMEEDECIISFSNNAEGLSQEDIEHIFERFYIADKARTKKSTGLGLSIAKTLTKKIRGSLEARMIEDQFIIDLKIPYQKTNLTGKELSHLSY